MVNPDVDSYNLKSPKKIQKTQKTTTYWKQNEY